MPATENKAIVRRVFEEAFNGNTPDLLDELAAPGFVDHDPIPGQPPGVPGVKYVVGTLHTAYPDLRFTIEDLLGEGDKVAIRWTLHGTHTGPFLHLPPTGAPIAETAIVIFRLADGKIVERWAAFGR